MKQSRIENAMLECYRELYKHSTPSADFDILMKTADKNEFDQLIIPFIDYEIDSSVMDEIIKNTCKKYRFNRHTSVLFRNSILLGCSPKTKFDNE
jgi:hypothetical protein